MKNFLIILGIFVLLTGGFLFYKNTQSNNSSDNSLVLSLKAKADITKAVKDIIASLNDEEKKVALIEFDNAERTNFNFIPMDRKGLRYRDMNQDLRNKTMDLLKTVLSNEGHKKITEIMSLEIILGVLENNGGPNSRRDPEKYWLAIFGEPGKEKAWGWRFEGHHLSLNYTAIDNQLVAYTPQFLGANPAKVLSGEHKGKRVLKGEEDLGRALVTSLDNSQKEIAIFSETAPQEIFTANNRSATLQQPQGITFGALNNDQKEKFKALINIYTARLEKELAKTTWDKINHYGIENLQFSWAGGLEVGDKHYYRIQGKSLLIEYDNTQGNGNHIHTVIRDIENDFGDDLLKKHYENSHH